MHNCSTTMVTSPCPFPRETYLRVMALATGSLLCMTENMRRKNSSVLMILLKWLLVSWTTFNTLRRSKLLLKRKIQDREKISWRKLLASLCTNYYYYFFFITSTTMCGQHRNKMLLLLVLSVRYSWYCLPVTVWIFIVVTFELHWEVLLACMVHCRAGSTTAGYGCT